MKKSKIYIIAEIGSNHDGDLNIALDMIEQSAKSGVDAVKFQTFKAEKLLNPLVFSEDKAEENWVYKEFERVEIDEDFHIKLREKCDSCSVEFISSPFDEQSLKLVGKYCDRIKIASSEISNISLLKKVGAFKKPVILSTGMAFLGEIEEAISALIQGGVTDLSLLHCVSLYPLDSSDANLKVVQMLKNCFGLKVGFSDHSLDDALSLGAVALGAEIIEKHVTLKREDRIFDHAFSMEFSDLKLMSEKIRSLENALGDGIKKISASEMEIRLGSHRSFFAAKDIQKGEAFSLDNVKAVRPLIGIPAKYEDKVIGRFSKRDIPENYPIHWGDLS